MRQHREDPVAKQVFERHKAVNDTVPKVTPMFWSFRIMVGPGFAMLLLFGLTFWSTLKSPWRARPWLLKWAVWMLPAPRIACELGSLWRTSWTPWASTPCC